MELALPRNPQEEEKDRRGAKGPLLDITMTWLAQAIQHQRTEWADVQQSLQRPPDISSDAARAHHDPTN